eukprot:COSAG01_NODE_3841_length_5646_cov_2.225527_4_plen_172_part_01
MHGSSIGRLTRLVVPDHFNYADISIATIILRHRMSPQACAVLDANLGFEVTPGGTRVPGDAKQEMINKITKMVLARANEERALEAAAVAPTVLTKASAMHVNAAAADLIDLEVSESKAARRSVDRSGNIQRLRALIRRDFIEALEVWGPHDRALDVFNTSRKQRTFTVNAHL